MPGIKWKCSMNAKGVHVEEARKGSMTHQETGEMSTDDESAEQSKTGVQSPDLCMCSPFKPGHYPQQR
jgi:hypothetical protein